MFQHNSVKSLGATIDPVEKEEDATSYNMESVIKNPYIDDLPFWEKRKKMSLASNRSDFSVK